MEKGKGWGSGAWDCWSKESRMEWIGKEILVGLEEEGKKVKGGKKREGEKGRGRTERKWSKRRKE